MISESESNEKIERETSRMASVDYGFGKSPSQLLQEEKIRLTQRLQQIDAQEGIPEQKQKLLQEEVKRRRHRFNELRYDKQLSDQAIKMQFDQQTSDKGFIFKEKK